jgi:hypothetical protein
MREEDKYNHAFVEGYDMALELVLSMIKGGVERHGMKTMKGLSPDSYDQCSHGKYRYQDCYECLKLAIGRKKEMMR